MPSVYDTLARSATGSAATVWTALFPPLPAAEPGGLWKTIEAKINTSTVAPRPLPDVEAHQVLERGKITWVLKRRATNTYLRLSEEDQFIWSQMDGQRTVLQLTIAYMKHYKTLALGRVSGLVEVLSGAGLLEGGPPDVVYGPLHAKLASRGYRAWLGWLMETFLFRQLAVSGFSGVVDAAWRGGVWLFYTRPMLILYFVVALAGLGVYLFGPQTSLTMPATVASAVGLGVSVLAVLFLHECGHAFTVKYFGRDVNRGGVFLMFGVPGAFVDTTDMWLAPKLARLAVTAAGPLVHFILGGGAALLSLALPESASDLRRFALINYLLIIANLTPFIKLDGYYLLMDALEIANLRERAVAFVGRGLWLKIRQGWARGEWRPRLTREETLFVIFGGISSLYTFYFLYFGTLFLPARLLGVMSQLRAINLRSLASLGVLVSVGFTLAFGVAQIMLTADRLRSLTTRLTHAVRNLPMWQSVALIAGVASIIAYIPVFLVMQARALNAAQLWGAALPILTTALAAGLAANLMRGVTGSPWRWWYAGLALTGIGLALVAILERTLWIETTTGLPVRLALAGLAVLSLVPALRLMLTTLRGNIGGAWLLIGLALVLVVVPNPDVARLGGALLLGGLFFAWQLIHRPLPPPLRPLDMTSDETDPVRQGAHLGRAFAWLMESLLTQAVEILGSHHQAPLSEAFNREAVEHEWPMWFNAHGGLADQTAGSPAERGAAYRAALTGWLNQIAHESESHLAADALIAAYFELPMRLRRLAAVHILSDLKQVGPAPWQADEGGDRLKLKLAFRHLAEWPVRACERVYGRPLAEQMMAEFNRVAALAEWNLWFRANGRLSEETPGDLPTLTEVFQSALADVLGRMAYYTGAEFVAHSLLQAHDTLPWQLREVAAPTLLRALPWARALNIGHAFTLADVLRHTPAFSGLPTESLTRLAAHAKVERLSEQQTLHRAGQTLRWARVIRAGRVELITHDSGTQRVARVLDPGALIGHAEILHSRPAETEARAVTGVEVIRLPIAVVTRALRDAPPRPEATLLSRIPLFRELPSEALRRLAEALQPHSLLAGETAARYGEPSRELYLISAGEFVVSVPDAQGQERTVAHLGPGEFFGEMALLRDEPRAATVRAIADAQVWSLSAADYAAFLRDTPALQAALEQVGSRRQLELRTA